MHTSQLPMYETVKQAHLLEVHAKRRKTMLELGLRRIRRTKNAFQKYLVPHRCDAFCLRESKCLGFVGSGFECTTIYCSLVSRPVD
jgi:hypothetical protein